MKFEKAGECLAYSLTCEIAKQRGERDFLNLKSLILFLYLENYISKTAVVNLKEKIEVSRFGTGKQTPVFDYVLRQIAKELKKIWEFNGIDEMIDKLNQFTIPYYLFEKCDVLFAFLPEICKVKDRVYYIQKRDGRSVFRYADISVLRNELWNYEGIEDNKRITKISYRYSEIFGCNDKLEIIYLKPLYLKNTYVEYHIQTEEERIFHYKCLGVMGSILIIEKDGYLAVKVGDRVRQLKKKNKMEYYEVRSNELYVTAKPQAPVIFKPYRIGFYGEIIEVSYKEAMFYLWEQLKESLPLTISDVVKGSYSKKHSSIEVGDENGVFSLRYLDDYFNEMELENDRVSRMYYFLVKVLGKYLGMDSDVLDYFYLLLDISRKYEQCIVNHGVSEKLYWKIEELEMGGKLEKCIHDLEAFKELLLEDVYWNEERIRELKWDVSEPSSIGYFQIRDEKMTVNKVTLEEGVYVCGLILMSGKPKKGIVAYNSETSRYVIQYTRMLDKAEIQKVIESFHLEDKLCHIVIEEKKFLNNET